MQSVQKVQFSALMELIKTHSWIVPRAQSLTQLFLEDCSSEDEQNLVADLLARFKYVSAKTYVEKLNDLVLEIVTMPNITAGETIIAAVAADSSPDSSQALVQAIKVKFQEHGWNDILIINTFGTAFKKSKADAYKRKNIILVDEFIGSGRTVIGRVTSIKSQFNAVEVDVNIFVKVIFSSIVGIDALKRECINFSCLEIIPRGISDFESPEKASLKISSMIRLEEKLLPKYGKYDLNEYSLGYGRTESLIGIENGNTPNNVFPIFWWPKNFKGDSRNPLLTRFLGD